MDDLVERLNERKASWIGDGRMPDPLCQEAKARIERDAAVIAAADALAEAQQKALDRILDWSEENLTDETARDWFGHVDPALMGLGNALAAYNAAKDQALAGMPATGAR